MPRKAINREGQKFGMLTILNTVPSINKRPMSLCQCECGIIKVIQTNAVVFGGTTSCGCFKPILPDRSNNLINIRFGKLTVINKGVKPKNSKSKSAYWNCLCDCGNTKTVRALSLQRGSTQSCGCLRKEAFKDRARTHINKRVDSKEYKMYSMAKYRAKKSGIPFTITINDIVIPEYCPVLNIPIFTIAGEHCSNSPSLDRFIPKLGYIPGNISVISYKANTIKSNATLEEIQLLLKWMEAKI
jgi:hypothetical protein